MPKAIDLRKKDIKELHQLLAEEREKLRKLRFNLVSGKVKNIREIRATRKTIARILTVINLKSQNHNLKPKTF
jgi:large subunit ribosomal protein L29